MTIRVDAFGFHLKYADTALILRQHIILAAALYLDRTGHLLAIKRLKRD